jgi:hypothetical protein
VLHERFPDTPIYMTADALEQFKRMSGEELARNKASAPSETPDSVPTPEVLPTTIFTVDGETVEVIKDFQGDVLKTTNSFVWIPSLRAVIAGDISFQRRSRLVGRLESGIAPCLARFLATDRNTSNHKWLSPVTRRTRMSQILRRR